jgi:cysteine synthase A
MELVIMINNNIIDLIGNTPLIKLKYPSEITGCEIYGKAEFLNPGGSIKDRTALGIIMDAEEKKQLEPNGIVVEGTFGNTGIGLTLVNNAKGYRTIIVMPNITVPSKRDILRNMGAELHLVDPAPYSDDGNYQKVSQRLAEKLKQEEKVSVIWAGQFENEANYKFHQETTAVEIFEQTNGALDGFTCAIGTGGTLTGAYLGLKEKNTNIKIACTDSQGSSMYNYFINGIPEKKGEPSITEGIGQARITKNLEKCSVDMSYYVSDYECMDILYKMVKTEGLFLGLSSGVNVMGAIKMAKEMGPGKKIVTILCDDANKYYDKMYNKEYLKSLNLPVPEWI